jgi:hypothetical protein
MDSNTSPFSRNFQMPRFEWIPQFRAFAAFEGGETAAAGSTATNSSPFIPILGMAAVLQYVMRVSADSRRRGFPQKYQIAELGVKVLAGA